MENTKFENISTCVTITRNTLEELREAICNAIQQNFLDRLNGQGITRRCPRIKFVEGLGNNIDIVLEGEPNNAIDDDRTVSTVNYTYDTTNIYLSYNSNYTTGQETTELLNRYTVIVFFTLTSTIQGFSITNPSSLIDNQDGTYSIDVSVGGVTRIVQFKQTDNFISYDELVNNAYNPDNIDYDNIFIRNKLLANNDCYYELSITDLINNNERITLPFINDRIFDINNIPVSSVGEAPITEYYVSSVLENTDIEYSVADYPVLFPKIVVDYNNKIKGYIDFVYDVPTQILDTGDSLNNLYSGQLITLDGSQYILCDANTVIQMDNISITSNSINTMYDGRYHNFKIIYPDIKGVKVFATLISDSTTVLSKEESYIRSVTNSGIHSWYLYDMIPNEDEGQTAYTTKEVEFANINAGNYKYLYKICVPFNNFNYNTIFRKEEYLRIHRDFTIQDNSTSFANQYTSYTTQSSAIPDGFRVIAKLIEIEPPTTPQDTTNFVVTPKTITSPSGQTVLANVDNKDLYISGNTMYYSQELTMSLGTISYNNRSFIPPTPLAQTITFGAQLTFAGNLDKNGNLYYIIEITSGQPQYFTIADTVYVSYNYIPNVYLEYYGYSNVDIAEASLVGYNINENSIYEFDERDPKKYALDYYFATGQIANVSNTGTIAVSIFNDIKLSFAYDVFGEPGDWTVVSETVPSTDGFQYISLEPQYNWGYPRFTNVDGNITFGEGDSVDDFSNTTLTKTIWYKIECPNYKTITGKGEVTINNIPLKIEIQDPDYPDDPTKTIVVPAEYNEDGHLVPKQEITPIEPYDPETDNPQVDTDNIPVQNEIIPEYPDPDDIPIEPSEPDELTPRPETELNSD